VLLWAEALTTPALAPMFRERDWAFRGEIREDVAAGIAATTIRADVDPAAVSVAVLGQLRGIWMLQQLLDSDVVDTRTLSTAVADQWRRALMVQSSGARRRTG
jgi:BetI-type transcriptional repressor, C-terminal